MIKGSLKQEVSINSILDQISELEIFRHYFKDFTLNQSFCNTFRGDRNPSSCIYYKDGKFKFKDFSVDDWSGDIFHVVGMIYGCSFNDTLKHIINDLGLNISVGPLNDTPKQRSIVLEPIIEKKQALIQVITRAYTKEEEKYWLDYSISREKLRKNEIYAIKKIYLNKKLYPLKDSVLRFGYLHKSNWKLYFPLEEKRKKWLSNIPLSEIEGLDNLKNCEKGILTKARKDRIILSELIPTVASVQNESRGAFIEKNVNFIKNNVKIPYINFDADNEGKKASLKVTKEYNWKHLNVEDKYLSEGIKDFASLVKHYGMNELERYLKLKEII